MNSPKILQITDAGQLPAALRGGVVAIGNFDGVHRGHQSVLDLALDLARQAGVPAIVLTFEPHPRSYFRPNEPVFRLTPAPMRARLLEALGFDAVVEQQFDADFSCLTADQFVEQVLIGQLGISHAVTGVDFHFGKGRTGGPAFLMSAGEAHGFAVSLVDSFRDENATIISSSRIRTALGEGDVVEAAGLLGYHYTVEGEVSHGRKLGRTLGYPTANMVLPPESRLAHGIYAVKFRTESGTIHDGVASYGRRPTVTSDGEPLLETFIFDYSGNLYDQHCSVSFFGFLRGEEKFDDIDALVVQMKRDESDARALLSGVKALGRVDQAIAFSSFES